MSGDEDEDPVTRLSNLATEKLCVSADGLTLFMGRVAGVDRWNWVKDFGYFSLEAGFKQLRDSKGPTYCCAADTLDTSYFYFSSCAGVFNRHIQRASLEKAVYHVLDNPDLTDEDNWDSPDAPCVTCLAVSSQDSGGKLATGSELGIIRLWGENDKDDNSAATLKGHAGRIQCLRFTLDGKRLISIGADNKACVWDATIKARDEPDRYADDDDDDQGIVDKPDRYADDDDDDQGIVDKSESRGPLFRVDIPHVALCMSIVPDSDLVLIGSGRNVYTLDLDTKRVKRNGDPVDSDIISIDVCPINPNYYAIGTLNHGVFVRNTEDGGLVFQSPEQFTAVSARWVRRGKGIAYISNLDLNGNVNGHGEEEEESDVGVCDVSALNIEISGLKPEQSIVRAPSPTLLVPSSPVRAPKPSKQARLEMRRAQKREDRRAYADYNSDDEISDPSMSDDSMSQSNERKMRSPSQTVRIPSQTLLVPSSPVRAPKPSKQARLEMRRAQKREDRRAYADYNSGDEISDPSMSDDSMSQSNERKMRSPSQTVRIPSQTVRIPSSPVRAPSQTVRIPSSPVRAPSQTLRIPSSPVRAPSPTLLVPSSPVRAPSPSQLRPTQRIVEADEDNNDEDVLMGPEQSSGDEDESESESVLNARLDKEQRIRDKHNDILDRAREMTERGDAREEERKRMYEAEEVELVVDEKAMEREKYYRYNALYANPKTAGGNGEDNRWWAGRIAMSPNGKKVAGYIPGAGIVAFGLKTGKRVRMNASRSITEKSGCCVFHPTNLSIIFIAEESLRAEINLKTHQDTIKHSHGSDVSIHGMRKHASAVRSDIEYPYVLCLAVSPDGKVLASGSDWGIIRLWILEFEYECTLMGHAECIRCLCFAPDGTRLISSADDNTIRVWNDTDNPDIRAHKRECQMTINTERTVTGISALPNSPHILVCDSNQVYTLQLDTGRLEPNGDPVSSGIDSIDTCPTDPNYYAIGTMANGIIVRDARNGKTISPSTERFNARSVKWTPDGRKIAYFVDAYNIGVCDAGSFFSSSSPVRAPSSPVRAPSSSGRAPSSPVRAPSSPVRAPSPALQVSSSPIRAPSPIRASPSLGLGKRSRSRSKESLAPLEEDPNEMPMPVSSSSNPGPIYRNGSPALEKKTRQGQSSPLLYDEPDVPMEVDGLSAPYDIPRGPAPVLNRGNGSVRSQPREDDDDVSYVAPSQPWHDELMHDERKDVLITFGLGGTKIAMADGNQLQIWSRTNVRGKVVWKCDRTITGLVAPIKNLHFTGGNEDASVTCLDYDGRVWVYHVKKDQLTRLLDHNPASEDGLVTSIANCSNSALLVAGFATGFVKSSRFNGPEFVLPESHEQYKVKIPDGSQAIKALECNVESGSNCYAVTGDDRIFKVDAVVRQSLGTPFSEQSRGQVLRFSDKGKRVATWTVDEKDPRQGKLSVFNTLRGDLVASLSPLRQPRGVCFSLNGQRLYYINGQDQVMTIDLSAGDKIPVNFSGDIDARIIGMATTKDSMVAMVGEKGDGSKTITLKYGETVKTIECKGEHFLHWITLVGDRQDRLALFKAEERKIREEERKMREEERLREIGSDASDEDEAKKVSYSIPGNLSRALYGNRGNVVLQLGTGCIAVATADRIQIYSIRQRHSGVVEWKCRSLITGLPAAVRQCYVWERDGKYPRVACLDYAGRVWTYDTKTCQLMYVTAPDPTVTCLADAGDPDVIMTGSTDGTVRVRWIGVRARARLGGQSDHIDNTFTVDNTRNAIASIYPADSEIVHGVKDYMTKEIRYIKTVDNYLVVTENSRVYTLNTHTMLVGFKTDNPGYQVRYRNRDENAAVWIEAKQRFGVLHARGDKLNIITDQLDYQIEACFANPYHDVVCYIDNDAKARWFRTYGKPMPRRLCFDDDRRTEVAMSMNQDTVAAIDTTGRVAIRRYPRSSDYPTTGQVDPRDPPIQYIDSRRSITKAFTWDALSRHYEMALEALRPAPREMPKEIVNDTIVRPEWAFDL